MNANTQNQKAATLLDNGIGTNQTLTPPTFQPDSAGPIQPEFGRWRDVQNAFGLKRGLLHLLVAEGKIKSVLIRRKGNVHGTRYYHLASVSAYLHAQMAEQETLISPGSLDVQKNGVPDIRNQSTD